MIGQRGSVALVLVGYLTFALALLGLVVDTGRLIVDHTRLQGAVDSCALALAAHPEWSEVEAQQSAETWVTLNSAGHLEAIDRSGAPLMRCKAKLSGWSATLLSWVGMFSETLSAEAAATIDPSSKKSVLIGAPT